MGVISPLWNSMKWYKVSITFLGKKTIWCTAWSDGRWERYVICSKVTKVQILLKSLTLTVLDNHGIFSSCFSEDDSEISIDLLVCFFQTIPGNDWYDYDNANDCANYCPDVQVKLRNNGNDNGITIIGSFRFDIRVRYFSVWNLLLQTRSRPRFGSIVVLEMCCANRTTTGL